MNNIDNAVSSPNPYGSLDADRLADFEKSIARQLPREYAAYLLKYNGGKFQRKNYFHNENIQASIHHMYGIHDGPEYLRLSKNYLPEDYYDLKDFSILLKDYIVFADTPTGELLLLNAKNGGIYFFDKSVFNGTKKSLMQAIIFFEESFDAFSRKLISDEELDKKMKESGVIDEEFEKLLARYKEERSRD